MRRIKIKKRVSTERIVAIATALTFIILAPITFFIKREYEKRQSEFLTLFNESQKLKGQLDEENASYFYGLVDGELVNLNGGSRVIYEKIKGLYKYKLLVDGKVVSGTEKLIYTEDCTITLEESFQATDVAPSPLLKDFCYLMTKGKGGDPVPQDEIIKRFGPGNTDGIKYDYLEDASVVFQREENYPYMTRLNIRLSNMTASNEFKLIFNQFFMDKFKLDSLVFSVRCVI